MVKKLKFDYVECLRKGLLRKIPKSTSKAEQSIKTAYKWLEEAEKNLQNESFNSCLLSSYLAMFHSARAILWFDGFREKSHACIGRYLEAVYVKRGLLKQKYVDMFDHYRDLRHTDSYSVSFYATKEECEGALGTAKEFVDALNRLLDKIQ
jgi:uncharacterized protein (UPF0332 family)